MSATEVTEVADQSPSAESSAPPPRASGGTRRRWWPWLMLLGLLFLLAYAGFRWLPGARDQSRGGGKATGAQRNPVPVIVAQAQLGDLPIYLDGLGTVTAFNAVTIRTRVDGELIHVAFVEGQLVQAGDLLAEIDPRPYQAQLDQAEGQLAKDEASLKFAKIDLARYRDVDQRAITQEQRDTATALVEQGEAVLQSDRAQIEAIKLQLIYCRITAPLFGRIGLRTVDQGNIVHAADPTGLALATQLQPVSVVFSLAQDRLPVVLRAMSAGQMPPAEVYDSDFRVLLAAGQVSAVDNQIDPGTGTARFKAVFQNEDNRLFPNQFVNVRLLVDVKKDVVLVPAEAVQRSPSTSFVWVVKSDQMVEMRPVTPGATETLTPTAPAALTEIVSGLTPGRDSGHRRRG
jgi:multidrug efflux system membrane fusion protein